MGFVMASGIVGLFGLAAVGVKAWVMPLIQLREWRASNEAMPTSTEPGAERVTPLKLSSLGFMTHDPVELWERAEMLRLAGASIQTRRQAFTEGEFYTWRNELGASLNVTPLGEVPGVLVAGLPIRARLGDFPIRENDIVTAVNGYLLTSPNDWVHALQSATDKHDLVVEVIRNGRHRVIRFQESRSKRR